MRPQLFIFALFLFIPLAISIFLAYDYARESVKNRNWRP